MVGLGVLVFIVTICLMAPIYAHSIAHTNPFASNIQGSTFINGKRVLLLQQNTQGLGFGVTPIGPTWNFSHYFLGVDNQGRDVFARLLYGGRSSLLIGTASAVVCCIAATVLGLIAGYFGGPIDWVLSRIFDIIWAFPIYLLAISLSVVLLTSGLNLGPLHVGPGSLLLPIFIIAAVFIPYVARPLRGLTLSLREREFVEAARALGASRMHLVFKQILPNLWAPILVTVALNIPSFITTEAALTFLGAGVIEPSSDWGAMLLQSVPFYGVDPLYTFIPGIGLFLLVLGFNLFGDSVRDALDPKSAR